MTDATLEARLSALRDEIAWPATPDLAPAVRERIAHAPQPHRARPLLRLLPAVAVALAVLVAAAAIALAASPAVRARVKDWLGIGVVRIERVQKLPDIAPARSLNLGTRVASTAAATRAVGFRVEPIRALGAPDAVYVDDRRIPGGAASLVYLARPGLPPSTAGTGALLGEFRGDVTPFIKKIAVGTRISAVTVNALPGFWIPGPHVVLFETRDRSVQEQRPRLAGNTLVWVTHSRSGQPLTYRLETALGKDAALRLARSVR